MNAIVCVAALVIATNAGAAPNLTLAGSILLPHVEGRIDHFAIDAVNQRLFVAALGNNSVEVVDLGRGQVIHSITGLAEPQGLYYLANNQKLYVANGGDGALRIYDGKTWAAAGVVKLDNDADNVRYDDSTKRLYVGHGRGALGAVDTPNDTVVAETKLNGHPESFQLEEGGRRAFVNVPGAHQIAVVDRDKHTVVANWSLGLAARNFPMALDEAGQRLFVGCRMPARLLVIDTETGTVVTKLALHGDCDDLFFDSNRRLLYASCGEGFIDVFAVSDDGRCALKESVKTEPKARTCFLHADHLYLAVPRRGDHPAEIRDYLVSPIPAPRHATIRHGKRTRNIPPPATLGTTPAEIEKHLFSTNRDPQDPTRKTSAKLDAR